MALSARRADGRIELENGLLRLVIDPARLRLSIESHEEVGLEGFEPRVLVQGRALPLLRVFEDGVEEVETPPAARATLRALLEGDVELELVVDLAQASPGAELAVRVRNVGPAALAIEAVEPLAWSAEAGSLTLPGPAPDLRYFRMGYQSWSPAGFVALSDSDPVPRLPLVRTMHFGPFTPEPKKGLHVSDFATTLRTPGHAGLTLGFTSHHRFLNHIAIGHSGPRPTSLAAHVSTENAELAPGDKLKAERLWIGCDGPEDDGIATWAERAGREMQAPVPEVAGAGWCSWYQYFTKVTAEHVRANTAAIARLDPGIEVIQIDDGYQAAVGDWLEASDGFPDGIAPLAREIRGAGFRAGLWLAPFLVSQASKVASEHPDWILRSPGGRPRVGNVQPLWKGRTCYALDPTHPGVREWLGEVTGQVAGWGFDYLKLDFLYAGALGGRRHDPAAASAEAYRGGVRAMRDAAGSGAFLLGCGAPLGPSIGLFEAMRIGPDVGPSWRARTQDTAMGIHAAPCAENSLRNVMARAPLHGRLWWNDPDCVLLRDRDTKLSDLEVKTLAGAVAASGGLVVLSDELANLSDERTALLRRLLPGLGRAPELGPCDREIPERLLQRWPDGSALLFWVNLEEQDRAPIVDLERLGFQGPVHLFDVWQSRALGVHEGEVNGPAVPPRGSLLWRLTPADGSARVIGSTLHVGAGALETRSIESLDDGAAAVSLELPGSHSGRLWVAPAGREARCLGVGFRDRFELRVSSEGVALEDSSEMPDA